MINSNNANQEPTRLLYDRQEAARQLSISVRNLDYRISRKEIRCRKIGKRKLIPHGELVRFCRADHPDSAIREQAQTDDDQS
jgi:hypothetical protein